MATTKVRDYAKLAKDIRDAIGESNITSATHCATRLRLVLKESPSEETGTGKRYKKKSFDWYKNVISTNGEEL